MNAAFDLEICKTLNSELFVKKSVFVRDRSIENDGNGEKS